MESTFLAAHQDGVTLRESLPELQAARSIQPVPLRLLDPLSVPDRSRTHCHDGGKRLALKPSGGRSIAHSAPPALPPGQTLDAVPVEIEAERTERNAA